MLVNIIKYSYIFYLSTFITFKLTKTPYNSKQKVTSALLSIALALLCSILDIYFIEIKYLLPLLLLWFSISLVSSKPQVSFISSTVAFCISFCLHAVVSFLVDCIFFILLGDFPPYHLLSITSGLLQVLLVKQLLNIKRLRNGMTFLFSTKLLNFATIICLIFITCSVHFDLQNSFYIGFLSFILTFAFLIYWWQAQITKSYRRSLELRELESLRTEVVEKDILIQKLLRENDRLATITHRDNTLISTLTNSTCNYLMTDYANPAVAIEVRDSLIANIKKLSDGRLTLPDDYNEKKARNFETGFSLMNDMLHNMDEDAIKMDITFSVHVGVMLKDFVPQDISEMDLVHLVDDLLKNAFKATKNSEPRVVQLQFYKVGKHFVVEVADSGIPFEVKSLVNMGISKLTTYEDGSGIGLMDIWNTKEECRATYHIEEYDTPAPFTKKISLTFDGKNRYSIRTSRKDEILQMSKRADLQVYGYEE